MTATFREFGQAEVRVSEVHGGVQHLYTFPNGWGASVVRHSGSYGSRSGLWELAVLDSEGAINYEHPVSEGDVRGYLTVDDVNRLLGEISSTEAPA